MKKIMNVVSFMRVLPVFNNDPPGGVNPPLDATVPGRDYAWSQRENNSLHDAARPLICEWAHKENRDCSTKGMDA